MEILSAIPVIPVAHHQIVVDTGLRLVHIIVDICRIDILGVDKLRVVDMLLIGSNAKALDTALDTRNLLWL